MHQVTTSYDVWTFRDRTELGSDIVDTHADISGFHVEALDGSSNGVAHLPFAADITGDRKRFASLRFQVSRDGPAQRHAPADERHLRAFAGKKPGRSLPDA